jgi:M6 family metalloprotease-like protein
LILILISLTIGGYEIDSLKNFVHPLLVKKRAELLNENPDYRKYFNPYNGYGYGRSKFSDEFRYRQQKVKSQEPETVYVAAIRVQFLPDSTTLTTGDGRMDLEGSGSICDTIIRDNDTNYVRSLYYDPPHDYTYFNRLMEYLHNYFWKVSYNKLWIEWVILPDSADTAYTLPHKMTYYGDPSNYVIGLFKLLRDAVEVADYDADFSGIDEVIIFHAGSMYQSDYLYDSPYDLPAVSAHGLHYVFGSFLVVDGDTIDSGIIYPETGFQDGVPSYLQGGLCHEFAHSNTVGLLDLYDVSGETMGMGGWALMGTGNWNQLGLVPPRICAYNRIRAGFDEPVIIDRDSTSVPIKWIGSNDTLAPRIYKVPINKDEYFLIENRWVYINPDTVHYVNPCTTLVDSNGARVWKDNVLVDVDDFDSSLPGALYSGGLAIWHIDEEKIRESEDMNELNAGFPHAVDLEEADGIQDFEKNFWHVYNVEATFYGSYLDIFREGGWLSSFTDDTDPNTTDNSNNYSGIVISNVSEPDSIMYFDISFLKNMVGFPKEVGDRMDVISPQALGGSIYIGDMFGGVYRINPDTTLFRMVEILDSSYTDSTYTTPLLADITGDGNIDLFDMTIKGKLFLFDLEADSILDSISIYDNIYGNASASDLDGIPGKEILFGTAGSELHILRWDGNSLVEMDGFPLYVGDWLVSTPLVIDNFIYILPADGRLWKISKTGDIIWRKGEEYLSYSISSPIAGDIDRDGVLEIVCSVGKKAIVSIDTSGIIEWEKEIPAKTYFSTPALGDITGDGYLEIVFADSTNLFALNRNGVVLDNFPVKVNLSEQTQSSIILADVSGDSLLDIIFGSPDGGVLAYDGWGQKVAEFPFTTGRRSYSTPLVVDIDDDKRSELLIGSYDGWLYGWETPGFYRKDAWNQIYFNNDHLSVYPDSLLGEINQSASLTLDEFYIYPSPVSEGTMHFRFTLGSDANRVILRVYSLSGRLVVDEEVVGNSGINDHVVNISREANGVYIATVEVGDNILEKKKFAILRGG